MIPGRRTAEGQLVITAGPPLSTDPRMAGFAMKPTGEIYVVGTQSAFTPANLFLNGEQGAWYDPSDLSTMFQDREGTTPVTADGQTVGLILDKSKGLVLGSELITDAANREFSSDTGFWAKEASSTISGGVVNVNNPTLSAAIYKLNFPNEPGGYYEISFDLNLSAGSMEVVFASSPVPITGGNGRKTLRIYRPTVNTFGIRTVGATTAVGTIDNLTIKRIEGNHAVAPSDAARPLYKTDGTYHWLQFDGVDDFFQVLNIGTNELISLFSGITYDGVNPITVSTGTANASTVAFNNATSLISSGNGITSSAPCPATPKFVGVVIGDGPSFSGVARRNGLDLGLAPIVGGASMNSIQLLTIAMNANGFGNPTVTSLYSLIVRGALSSPDEITETETWVNGKTGAY